MAVRDDIAHLLAAGVNPDDLAVATGVPDELAEAWLERHAAITREHADRIASLAAITRRMRTIVVADEVPVWLRRPLPALDGRSPLQAIASGDHAAVEHIVGFLESPGAI